MHSTQAPPKALSTRLIGVKPPTYPASSDSFVVLKSSSQPLQALHPVSASTLVEEDSNWNRNNTLSHRLRVANRVFDIMSSKSSVDHPMCQECTDMLLECLEKQMNDVGRERDCYIEFMKRVKDSRVTKEEEEELAQQVEEVRFFLFLMKSMLTLLS